jgi:hypothetical protein
MPAEAMAGITNFFPSNFFRWVVFHAQSSPHSNMVCLIGTLPKNGRQAVTGGSRGGGRCCRCQKKINSTLFAKKQKPGEQSAAHDIVSGSIVPESVEDCRGWRQRLWQTSPMVGMFCCCGCVIYDRQLGFLTKTFSIQHKECT